MLGRAPARRARSSEDALEAAVAVLEEHPDIGRIYQANPSYRTWRLKGTPYVLFYRVDEEADTIWVVVAWGGRRGAGQSSRVHAPMDEIRMKSY